jgi:hypothetical protein
MGVATRSVKRQRWLKGRFSALCLLSSISSCTPALVTPMRAVAPADPDTTYDCVLREVGRSGYRVTDADRASRFVRAEKQTDAPDFLDVGYWAWDELTLVVTRDEAGGSELHITPSRSTQGEDEPRGGSGPSIEADADAVRIAQRCGATTVEAEEIAPSP